jgi:hypothetical protein
VHGSTLTTSQKRCSILPQLLFQAKDCSAYSAALLCTRGLNCGTPGKNQGWVEMDGLGNLDEICAVSFVK